MTTSIELDDLAAKQKQQQEAQEGNLPDDVKRLEDIKDNTVAIWAWVSASLLAILSLPLLLFPRFLLFLSVPDDGFDNRLTPLERFLSAQFGMFLVTIAITLVLYIPDTSVPIELRRRRDSLGHPLLGPLTGTSLIAAFVSYNTKTVGSLAFLFFLFTAIIGSWGMWVALFEGSSHVSRKTGADKRTSAFLFGNKTAASKQKKEWKRAQSGGAIR